MRIPLFLRNLPVLARAGLNPRLVRQLLRRGRVLRREHGLSRGQLLRFALLLLRGERAVFHDGRLIISSVVPSLPSPAFESLIRNPQETAYCPLRAGRRSGPVSIFIAVTAQCPCHCPHCSREGRRSTEEELSTAELGSAIADLLAMNVATIGLTGGEPLTRPDLAEIIAAIGGRASSILFTTGIGLTPERAREFKRNGLFAIAVSLDFHEEEEHNRFRGHPDAYRSALRAMETAAAAGLYVIAMTVVARKNLSQEYVFKLARLVRVHGAREIRLLEPVRSGRCLEAEEELFYSEADRRRFLELYHRGNRTLGLPKFTTYLFIESAAKFGCGAGILHSYLGETGELCPCDFIPVSFGNIRRGRLPQLWAGMRQAFGTPRCSCIARRLNEALLQCPDLQLPLPAERSGAFCRRMVAEIPAAPAGRRFG